MAAHPIRGPAIVAAAFLGLALPSALWLADIADDEGYLTFLLARIVGQEPIAGLFFLKTRPLISALHALPAALGFQVFLAWHVAVAAGGVLLVGLAARRLGGRGGVAAAVLALSPVHFHAAVSGYPNSDGLAIAALALYLSTCPTRLARTTLGVTLSLGFLGRFEFAPVFAALLLHAAVVRRDALVVGSALAVGLAYVLSGAAYHGDLLWPLAFPPAFPEPPAYHASFFAAQRLGMDHLGDVAVRFVAVTPWCLLPLAVKWRVVPSPARWFAGACAVSFALILLFPASGGVFWFPHLARHFLVWLPCVALAAAYPRSLSTSGARRVLWGLPAFPLAAIPWWGWRSAIVAWAFAAPAIAANVRGTGRRTLVAAGAFILLASSTIAFFAGAFRADLWRETRDAMAFVETTLPPGVRVFTNVKGLAPGLEARGHDADVRFLPNHSIPYELQDLTNPRNGQRARVARAIEGILYGRALWPCRLVEEGPGVGDWLVWLPDHRLDVVFPMSRWLQESERVWGSGSIEARRFAREPARTPPREGPAGHVADFPCRDLSGEDAP